MASLSVPRQGRWGPAPAARHAPCITSPGPLLGGGLRPRSHQRVGVVASAGRNVNKGLSLLEWTGKLVPQGQLVAGVKEGWRLAWQTMVRELAPQTKDGQYARPQYSFNGWIGRDARFPVEAGRYHVYLGNACPWCHRVLLALVLRGLLTDGRVTVTQLASDPTKARRGGWIFDPRDKDPLFGATDLWEVYDRVSPGFRGRCTAPLLVDKQARTIVSNESSDIVRMLNDMHLPGCTDVDLYPPALRRDIDALNDMVYTGVNNGVYRSGFATTQAAYDTVQQELFTALDQLEGRLAGARFLLGDRLTEADLRLYPTVVRFDAVYAGIFKCSRRRIADYPNLSGWMRDMAAVVVPGSPMQVSGTVDVDAARVSYYTSLFPLNPSLIVPSGPTAADLRLGEPSGRGPGGAEALQDLTYSREGGAAQAAGEGRQPAAAGRGAVGSS